MKTIVVLYALAVIILVILGVYAFTLDNIFASVLAGTGAFLSAINGILTVTISAKQDKIDCLEESNEELKMMVQTMIDGAEDLIRCSVKEILTEMKIETTQEHIDRIVNRL